MLRIDGKLFGGAGDRHGVESSYDTTALMPSVHKGVVLLQIGMARSRGLWGGTNRIPLFVASFS
jgi:hypothetical protein